MPGHSIISFSISRWRHDFRLVTTSSDADGSLDFVFVVELNGKAGSSGHPIARQGPLCHSHVHKLVDIELIYT
jgi:hypothetical protein